MKVIEQCFAVMSDGREAKLFTIENSVMSFSVTNYGCCITSILLPSKQGGFDDVVLGYSDFSGYLQNKPYFGALVGRCAGRIAHAEFTLDTQQYLLTPNDQGGHCLHGGYPSYSRILWQARTFCDTHAAGVVFSRISPDGEQGFPGELNIEVTYSLTEDNEIVLRYDVVTSKTTPINLTNHTYFNLNPAGMQADGSYVSVLNHVVQICASSYAQKNDQRIPTGEILPVNDSLYDFRTPKSLDWAIADFGNFGYDDTWIIRDKIDEQKALAAIIVEPITNRQLWVYSTLPALTMYTADFLANVQGKNGNVYNRHSGLCLESQYVPDAVHHQGFLSVFLQPHDRYQHETVWLFKI